MSQTYQEILGAHTLSASRTIINNNLLAVRSRFVGPTAPSNPQAHDQWLDTTSGYEKDRNDANDAWIIMGKIGTAYRGLLPTTGGVMTGPIDMGGCTITNLGLGSGIAAARQQELDLKAPIAAPLFTGDARVSQDPAGNDSIPRRAWCEGRYLQKTGGTMTGPIILPGNASQVLHAVPYQQVRDFVEFSLTAGHRHDGADARRVKALSLDSETAPSNAVLRANGSGGVGFSALPANYMSMLEGRQLLVQRNSSIGWTTLDISAYVPAGAIMALMQIQFYGVSGAATLQLRKTGTSPASPQTWNGDVSTYQQLSTFINCVGRHFDYYMDIAGATISIYLLGYVENI